MKTNKKAFTLVELIVVITILAILGTIAFISFQNYTQSARDGTRIADINNIKKNLEIFITEKWFYPLPDNPTPITYNGWIARTQWTVWDNVITNLRNLSKKPTDPLSNNEYTYSITNAKTEYQLAYVTEWWLSYNTLLTNQANAATLKIGTAKVTGTYNEKILKVSTWSIDYILALPSIISTDITDVDVQSIINNRKLVYNNYTNIPDSYKNLWYTMTGWFDFAPPSNNIVVLSWATISLETWTGKVAFIDNLKTIYNTAPINQEPTYKEIINATDTNEQVALVDAYISNHVWGIVGVISTTTIPTIPPFVCGISTVSAWWYTYNTKVALDWKCRTIWSMKHWTLLANGNTPPSDINTIEKWCPMPNWTAWTVANITWNCDTYSGALYTWYEAMWLPDTATTTTTEDTSKSVCWQLGSGWAMPTDSQWTAFTTSWATWWTWIEPNGKLNWLISSLPGIWETDDSFYYLASYSSWWSSNEYNATNAKYRCLNFWVATVCSFATAKMNGGAVLCLKN